MTETVHNVIDGESFASSADRFIDLVDPTTGEVDGASPISPAAEVDAAYAAADRAFPGWAATTPRARQEMLLTVADAVLERADDPQREVAGGC